MRLRGMLIVVVALVLPGTAAAQAPDPCAGIADCVVAPASPTTVIVANNWQRTQLFFASSVGAQSYVWQVPNPTSFTVACPSGLRAVRTSAQGRPGSLQGMGFPSGSMAQYPNPSGANAMILPRITAAPVSPPATLIAGGGNADGGTADASPASVVFSTALTTGIVQPIRTADVGVPDSKKTQSLQWGSPQATFTPTLACVPAPGLPVARRGADEWARSATQRLHHRNADVRRGTQRHWTRCPAGHRRVGPVTHALYVEGRTGLTRRELGAVGASPGPGGNHIVTRSGPGAPKGLKVQIQATCVAR